MGDAVTGINRADSASEKSNGPMLRQHHAVCNSSGCGGRFLVPDWQNDCVRAVSTADSGCRSGRARRLTHRRASLACEAPIARPWISAFDRRFARIGCRSAAVRVGRRPSVVGRQQFAADRNAQAAVQPDESKGCLAPRNRSPPIRQVHTTGCWDGVLTAAGTFGRGRRHRGPRSSKSWSGS